MKTRDISYAAMFTAVMAVASVFSRFFPTPGGVPFSLQPLVVFLTGGLLNKRTAALSMTAYVALGLIGIPVFTSAPFGGLGYIMSPTFGFLLGFILAAWLIALTMERIGRTLPGYLVACGLGLIVIYLVGLPYLYVILNFYLGKAVGVAAVMKIGLVPFIGFDLIKAGVAAILGYAVRARIYPVGDTA
ncbi:MAG: biotin transporter BioY [Candidatus Saccharibacteria bacterium]